MEVPTAERLLQVMKKDKAATHLSLWLVSYISVVDLTFSVDKVNKETPRHSAERHYKDTQLKWLTCDTQHLRHSA
jgi:hypothetical protein